MVNNDADNSLPPPGSPTAMAASPSELNICDSPTESQQWLHADYLASRESMEDTPQARQLRDYPSVASTIPFDDQQLQQNVATNNASTTCISIGMYLMYKSANGMSRNQAKL